MQINIGHTTYESLDKTVACDVHSRLSYRLGDTKNAKGNPMLLRSQLSLAPKSDREYEIAFATKPQGRGGYYVLRIRIPRKCLGELGDPARVVLTGTPHQGFQFTPTANKHEGHALNYDLPGHYVNMTTAFKPYRLTKAPRRMTSARAISVDGAIKTGGMPPGWIKAHDYYLDFATRPAAKASPSHRHSSAA